MLPTLLAIVFDILSGNDDDSGVKYPGGKGKTFPYLINLMPPHEIYVETHLGGGAVLRHKRPASLQIGIDIDAAVIAKWHALNPLCDLVCADAVEYLNSSRFGPNTLIYSDPPYMNSTRLRARVYRHDYSDADHQRLLECLKRQTCFVMISGYENEFYSRVLSDWNRVTFSSKTHLGNRIESVWLNYSIPARLHDHTWLGRGFREREQFKRRRARLKRRIDELPTAEQFGLLQWLQSKVGGAQ
ncbi:MAG: DNA adenine methylase [Terriglobales bacterium]